MRKRDSIYAAAGALAATLLAGGVAWAAIPGDGDVYTACMLKNVGTVRLIDKSLPWSNLMSHCKPSLEVEVSWNQKGQQGLQGAQGLPGQGGANGADGRPGAQGLPGPAGASGYEVVSATRAFAPGETEVIFAACPEGKALLHGSYQTLFPSTVIAERYALGSDPIRVGGSYVLSVSNSGPYEDTVVARVSCIAVGG